MLFKLAVITILIAVFFSLGSSLIFMIKDKGRTQRTAKALTVRISLSLALFMLLMVGYAAGLITPHGIYPTVP